MLLNSTFNKQTQRIITQSIQFIQKSRAGLTPPLLCFSHQLLNSPDWSLSSGKSDDKVLINSAFLLFSRESPRFKFLRLTGLILPVIFCFSQTRVFLSIHLHCQCIYLCNHPRMLSRIFDSKDLIFQLKI